MPVAKEFEEFKGFKEFELSVSWESEFFDSELPIRYQWRVPTRIGHAAPDGVPMSGIPRRDSGLKMAKVLKVLKVLNFCGTVGRRFFADIAARPIIGMSQVALPSR